MSDRLIVIAELADAFSAHAIRILLEASGVRAFVTGDYPLDHMGDRVLVHVAETDQEIARRIVNEVPAASEVMIPAWICECNATVDEGFHVCWSCGRQLPEDDSGLQIDP